MAFSELSPPRGVGRAPGHRLRAGSAAPEEERRNRPSGPDAYFLALTWTSVKIGSPSWPYTILPNTLVDWPELFL